MLSTREESVFAKRRLPRVVFVVGATASGKTALGLALAKKFKGEVINADARQIYKGLTIGTGKPLDGRRTVLHGHRVFMVDGVPHHLMDFLAPEKIFTVAEWQKKALALIRIIAASGRLPIVVGGTGLYVQALLDNYRIPSVPPNPAYRSAMDAKSLPELVAMLLHVDPEAVNVVDLKNRRRVLRALEVVTFTGKKFSAQRGRSKPVINALLTGPKRTREELYARIDATLDRMIEAGWIDEVRRLAKQGLPWEAPAMTSIGYREIGAYVRGERTLEETIARIKQATRRYAKRQFTWFKRDQRIQWVVSEAEAKKLVRKWLV